MTPTGYTEDALIEQPSIALMAELGWETFNAFGEFDPSTGSGQCPDESTLGRETRAEVILKSRLRLALLKINPEVSIEAIHQAIKI